MHTSNLQQQSCMIESCIYLNTHFDYISISIFLAFYTVYQTYRYRFQRIVIIISTKHYSLLHSQKDLQVNRIIHNVCVCVKTLFLLYPNPYHISHQYHRSSSFVIFRPTSQNFVSIIRSCFCLGSNLHSRPGQDGLMSAIQSTGEGLYMATSVVRSDRIFSSWVAGD